VLKHSATRTRGGVEINLHVFVTLAIDGGELSASRPCCFIPRETALRHPLYRRLGGPHEDTYIPRPADARTFLEKPELLGYASYISYLVSFIKIRVIVKLKS
jgi:hypothetical protein